MCNHSGYDKNKIGLGNERIETYINGMDLKKWIQIMKLYLFKLRILIIYF